MDNLIGKKLDGLYEVKELIGERLQGGHAWPERPCSRRDSGGGQGAAAGVYA